jgi:hypothetical protein
MVAALSQCHRKWSVGRHYYDSVTDTRYVAFARNFKEQV